MPKGCEPMSKINILIALYGVFIISTITTLFIVYKDIDQTWSYYFLISYIIFLICFVGIFFVSILINLKKSTASNFKKRLIQFSLYFIILSTISFVISYLGITEFSLTDTFVTALGLSLGIAFFDLAFNDKVEPH